MSRYAAIVTIPRNSDHAEASSPESLGESRGGLKTLPMRLGPPIVFPV